MREWWGGGGEYMFCLCDCLEDIIEVVERLEEMELLDLTQQIRYRCKRASKKVHDFFCSFLQLYLGILTNNSIFLGNIHVKNVKG